MHWPQLTIIALFGVHLLATLVLHGKQRTGNWNFGETVTSTAIFALLLQAGGFWG